MDFYNAFIRRCQEAGVSPSVAAEAAGVSRSAVTKWKHGGAPTYRTEAAIAKYFGMSVEDFLSDKSAIDLSPSVRESASSSVSARAWLINAVATDMDDATAARALTILRAAGLIAEEVDDSKNA